MLGSWLYRMEDKPQLEHDLNMQNISRNMKIYQNHLRSIGSSKIIHRNVWGIFGCRISRDLQASSRPSSASSRDSSPSEAGDAISKTTSELGTSGTLRSLQRPRRELGRANTSVESRAGSKSTEKKRSKASRCKQMQAALTGCDVHLLHHVRIRIYVIDILHCSIWYFLAVPWCCEMLRISPKYY